MHLSRLILNLANAGVRRDVKDWYELHRTLKRAIDGRDDERMLFRLEQPENRPPTVLVQTRTAPDWDRFQEEVPGYALRIDSKAVDPAFHAGQLLNFRLRANAVKKGANGKRVRLENEAEEREWLDKRFADAGATVVRLDEHTSGLTTMKHAAGTVYLHTVQADGVLQVTDPATFRDALQAGIGRAKGMGMGLLTVKRYEQ